ncbi:MAG: Bug family tripartite tricarboxylate transporter substrate binding protein [Zwartia sp.]|jgi:tripartite-type tricarboxylate transporter receptor subunit TctC
MGHTLKRLTRRLALSSALVALGLVSAVSQAAFPDKPVTIVVPYGVGGSSDAQARVVAQALSKKWGQPVVIDNRAGGQTVIGTSLVAKAKPDGYTILYVAFAWISNQFLIKELPYKASDLSPITTLGTYPLALLVRSDVPANTVAEYIAYAKAQNRPMNFGISTIGASMHFAALEFSNQTGVPMVFPPYKSGSIGALNDLIGKQIDGIFEGAVFKPHADGGRIKALFMGQKDRMPGWDLPSATEVGLPNFDMTAWYGLMVPSATPNAIQEQLSEDVRAVLAQPDVRERFAGLGVIADGMSPKQFEAFLAKEYSKLGSFIERNRAQLSQ